MSANGLGRGRGWLNQKIHSASVNSRPGGTPSPPYDMQNHNIKSSNMTCPSEAIKYQRIISTINLLDINDDGIKLNQKFKHILDIWKADCTSSTDVEESFEAVYCKCLKESDYASKIVCMVSSYQFITTTIEDIKLRNLFIGKIQQDFENRKQIQIEDTVAFRNTVKMLGEFYHRARLFDGRPIKFLGEPILQYLDMLLESAQPQDLQLFTVQLNLNGARLKEAFSMKLTDILIQVRLLLSSPANLTSMCKVWLLLALDVASNRFAVLPHDLQMFYQTQLGEKAMAEMQGPFSALSVQTTQSNIALDSYQSNVSVLQVNVSPSELAQSTSSLDISDTVSTSSSASKVSSSTVPHSLTAYNNSDSGMASIGTWEAPKEKTPRPILGAGARLKTADKCLENKGYQQQNAPPQPPPDSRSPEEGGGGGTWRDKAANENSTGWNSKQKNTHGSGWGGHSAASNFRNKGWEHDDRFETDYN